ncbi:hypothetical protein Sjap_002596 [Stephania japonica]|uniref:Uncharacterized protein n=1 Tax=Stephania japonica TaxID=461633 RepID=A0AAP0KMD4_9MAGN
MVVVAHRCGGGNDRRHVRGPTWLYTRASTVSEPQYVLVLWWNDVWDCFYYFFCLNALLLELPPWAVPLPSNSRDMGVVGDPITFMLLPIPRIPQQERKTIEDIEKYMISEWLSPSTNKYTFDDWSNSSSQPDTYCSMQNQPSRDIVRFLLETEQDMNLTEQELDQWIEQRDQETEEEIKSILQKISAETMSAIPLESVEANEPDIIIARNEAYEAEKEIDVILERPEEPQKESKEDQYLVLVKPPTLPCIFVRPYKGVVVKERSQIFYTADTFVSDDHDAIESYMLEVPNEFLNLKEGMFVELPKAIDAPFVVDISKGEGIT